MLKCNLKVPLELMPACFSKVKIQHLLLFKWKVLLTYHLLFAKTTASLNTIVPHIYDLHISSSNMFLYSIHYGAYFMISHV